jgi:two-component system chemotaxis response regulator CheY
MRIEDVLLQIVCLVVEDSEEDRNNLVANLKGVGAKEVLSAGSGSEALNLLNLLGRPVDLILSDIRMPGGNGLQLLKALRTGDIKGMRLNSTFVLTTAFPQVGLIQAAASLDANGFIVKPVDPMKFEAAILKARRIVFPPNPGAHMNVHVPITL